MLRRQQPRRLVSLALLTDERGALEPLMLSLLWLTKLLVARRTCDRGAE
jgi:hypothetical protein